MFRFTGTIARGASIRRCKSYRGRPSSRQEELELDERDHAELSRSLTGVPLCYNHKDDIVVGSVEGNRRRVNGDWDIDGAMPLDNPCNRELAAWIQEGKLHGLSLKHRPSTNEPIEVSLCFKGARPGTTIKKIMQYDSKSKLYNLASDSDDDIVQCSAADDDDATADAELLIVAASVTAMSESPAAAAAAASAPAPAAPAPAANADADAEMKEAEAVFVGTGKVSDILRNVHGIPSKAQREELAGITSKLELEKLELAEKNRAMEEQIQKHAAELEQVRKESEAKAKSLYEAEQQIHTQRALAGDLIKTLSDGKDDKVIDDVLASMGPGAMKFFADTGRQFVAASASSGDVDVVESEVQRNMRLYLAMKKKKAGAVVKPAQEEEIKREDDDVGMMQRQQHQPYRNLLPTHGAPAPAVVQASAGSRAGENRLVWGEPITHRPRDNSGRVVAASSSSSREDGGRVRYLPESAGEYDPGEGPRFDYSWMKRPEQIEVFFDAPTHDSAGHTLNLVQAGYSPEFIEFQRRHYNQSDDANKRKAATEAMRFNANQARELTLSRLRLPRY